jgi:1-aminocyclopropane-1-carboxylate deaminase/D-cysteine desulfhydrase-like pyridoxal-dependent ACC family enzyme
MTPKLAPDQPSLSVELAACLPTPVRHLTGLGPRELWVKNDGLTGTHYGGNKLRKLARIFERAAPRDIRRILTVGAAGSHHVLATTLYGSALGYQVAALIAPQFHTPHAERVFRCSVGLGLEVLPLASPSGWFEGGRRAFGRSSLWIGPGGIGATGSWGYVTAALELKAQIDSQQLPAPSEIVVAVGSGSTAAGLLVGVALHGLDVTVCGVQVTPNPAARPMILAQAWALMRDRKLDLDVPAMCRRLVVLPEFVGGGYGVPTPEGEHALQKAASVGLELEPTYTAKAFAAALARAERQSEPVLYWHTLSARPLEPLLAGAPKLADLPTSLRSLLRAKSI